MLNIEFDHWSSVLLHSISHYTINTWRPWGVIYQQSFGDDGPNVMVTEVKRLPLTEVAVVSSKSISKNDVCAESAPKHHLVANTDTTARCGQWLCRFYKLAGITISVYEIHFKLVLRKTYFIILDDLNLLVALWNGFI